MKIKILFFGVLSEVVSVDPLYIEDATSVDMAHNRLIEKYPSLKNYTYRIGLNREIISDYDILLHDADEIALLPPFSGG